MKNNFDFDMRYGETLEELPSDSFNGETLPQTNIKAVLLKHYFQTFFPFLLPGKIKGLIQILQPEPHVR